jgi:perosamine synthetase
MIPHNKPSIGIEESRAMEEVIASGWIAPGEKVKQFEQAFADYVGAEYAIAVNSGTAALTVALKALGIFRGNEIIVPTYACAAVVNAIYMATSTYPYLVDINVNDFNIDFDMIKKALFYKRHGIVIPHTYGVPADIQQFKQFKLPIIEDCSQALGSYINGQHVGLQGDIGIFSFGPSKMITTGSGGMLVTNNKDLSEKARDFTDYDKHIPAFNFAMDDLQAAMGIKQLKKLPGFLRRRECMAMQYIKCVLDTQKYWAVQQSNFNKRNWYRFIVMDECTDFVNRLKQHLANNGITAIVPIERHELLHNMLGLDAKKYMNAEWISTHGLSLPIYPSLLDEGFNQILDCLRRF